MDDLLAAMAATWPPAELRRLGPWTVRRGDGGGNRVSAATLDGPLADPEAAVSAMRAWGQRPLFIVRQREDALDALLANRGYLLRDPEVLMAAPAAALAEAQGEAVIRCAAPLARAAELWGAGGVGPERLAVMARAPEPKVWLLGRQDDRAAASAFVAAHGPVAMMHALEVAPWARRRGLGGRMTQGAAAWARACGAATLALAVTRANVPARALYGGLGLAEAGSYHYREAREAGEVGVHATRLQRTHPLLLPGAIPLKDTSSG